MVALDEFLQGQERIYSTKFGKNLLMEKGVIPEVPKQGSLVGGYLISFRHPHQISRAAEAFSRKIESEGGVPVQAYFAADLHTTISDMDKKEGFVFDEQVLNGLSKCVSDALSSLGSIPPARIDFQRWLYNPGAIVVAGTPNQAFVDISERVYSLGKQRGINVRMPWGAHISAVRFKEAASPERLNDFFKVMESAPAIGESQPAYLDVGTMRYTHDGFAKEIFETFPLNR